jgi:pimeloyl-[acyl-carrier protein] methyl ester esterase
MNFVFVHGWGFHAGLWSDVAARLGGETHLVDLGFVSGGPRASNDWPDDAVAIGHSLGLLWLLRQKRPIRALVSVGGFDCFCCHMPRSRVVAMHRALLRDPAAMLASFWEGCGAAPFAPPEALQTGRLAEGLDWLMDWDARGVSASLDCPVLALAARDDAIVPQDMSERIWGNRLLWSEDGGHVLPLSRPEWCADAVREFVDGLPA